jgi:WD40 repeat protein
MRNHSLLGMILILALIACSGAPPITSVPTSYQTTHIPTAGALDQVTTPTIVPSSVETANPTPEADKNPMIETENAGQVTELAKLGKGVILSDPAYAPEGMPIYSVDGKWLAIPTSGGIYLYDAATLEELRWIPASTPFIAFYPDASLLATSGHGTVTLWDPATGAQAGELPGNPEDWYWELSITADGSLLSAASSNREIAVWSLQSKEKIFTFPGDRLRFSPDGLLAVVVVYGENQVHLYETRNGTEVNQWDARNAGFTSGGQLWLEDDKSVRLVYFDRDLLTAPFDGVQPSFSVDGTLMALFADGQISIYDHQKGRRTQILEGDYIEINGVLFSPDGQTLAGDVYSLHCPTCTEIDGLDRSLVLWRATDGAIIASIDHLGGWIAYSKDGNRLIALEMESMQVINTADGSTVERINGFTNPVAGMAISPDGKTLAAVHAVQEYSLRLWDLGTGAVKEGHSGQQSISQNNVEVAYSRDGNFIAVGGDLWNLAANERLTTMEQAIVQKTSCWPSSVAFSPDGKELASGCYDGQLDLWSFPDGALIKSIGGYTSWVNGLAYSPDGKHLAAIYGVPDYLVQVWQLPEGTPSFELTGGHFTRVAYSSDGGMLATVAASVEYDQYGWPAGYVQLWDASDGKEIAQLKVDDAVSIAFSPDSRILATGSLDGTLRLWEIAGGKLLLEADRHFQQIQRLAFTPDGRSLISASLDGTIFVWGIPPLPISAPTP